MIIDYFAQYFSHKPNLSTYISNRLKAILDTEVVIKKYKRHMLAILLKIKHIDRRDKINIAKSFGVPNKTFQLFMKRHTLQAVVFSPKDQKIILANLQKSPKFEPELFKVPNLEQKIRYQRHQQIFINSVRHVLDYLQSLKYLYPLYYYFYKFSRFVINLYKQIRSIPDGFQISAYVILSMILFFIAIFTFPIWATIICLLIANYALRQLKSTITIKLT